LLATACAKPIPVSSFPPAADVEAVTTPKPLPHPDGRTVTDPQANARYDTAIERWGEAGYAAGVRLCEWIEGMGGKLPFECKRPSTVVVP
jgi:hypothetical protein